MGGSFRTWAIDLSVRRGASSGGVADHRFFVPSEPSHFAIFSCAEIVATPSQRRSSKCGSSTGFRRSSPKS